MSILISGKFLFHFDSSKVKSWNRVCPSVRACVRPSVRASVNNDISKNAQWIVLIFWDHIIYGAGMMHVILEF